MPAFARKRGDTWRVVERDNGKIILVKNNSGTPVDGGGHPTKKAAEAQARAINASNE